MSIQNRLILVLTAASILAAVAAACSGGPTTTDIVETSIAANKEENATATAAAAIAAGINPEDVQLQISEGSTAGTAIQAQAATATAQAAEGIFSEGVGSDAAVFDTGGAFEVEVPESAAESGVVVVDIQNHGADGTAFVPRIIKITVGSTVKWTNDRKAASSTRSHPDQSEEWNSKAMFKGTFSTEPAIFEHTFTELGCFTYRSEFSGDVNTGAVCVVEA